MFLMETTEFKDPVVKYTTVSGHVSKGPSKELKELETTRIVCFFKVSHF